MLCAASIMFGLTSRMLLSTSRATNGNAAITSGTIDASVPIDVPTISLVSGITITIRMMNGTERSRFISMPRSERTHFGTRMIPSFPPTASRIPSGSPMITAKSVARTVA